MAAKKQWWSVYATTPDKMAGEREGKIDGPTEEAARTKYLANPEHAGWIIHEIVPSVAPEKPRDPSPLQGNSDEAMLQRGPTEEIASEEPKESST